MKNKNLPRFVVRALVAAAVALHGTAAAVTYTWDGGGVDGNWSTAANWAGDTLPGYGTLQFSGSVRTTNTVTSNISQNVLLWTGSSAWTLNNSGGAVVSLYDDSGAQAKIENQSTGLVTINAPINFAATAGTNRGEINAINGNITFGSTGTINVSGSALAELHFYGSGHTVTIDSVLTAGARKLIVGPSATDNNTVILNAANSYSGNTEINVGTVQAGNSSALGTGAVYLGNGGTAFANLSASLLLNAAGVTVANNITTNKADTGSGLGTGTRTIGGNFTSGTGTYSGGIVLNGGAVLTAGNGGTVAFSGVIANGTDTGNVSRAVTVSGSGGTVLLSGGNTYTGTTSVNSGTLKLGNGAALGTTAAGTSVASGAVLDLNGQVIGAEALTINGSGISGTGALINSSATAASLSGTVALGSASTIGGTGNISLSGVVSGAFTLTKVGGGTLTLGNPSNLAGFSGGLTINAGTVVVPSAAGDAAFGSGTVTIGSAGTAQVNLSGYVSMNRTYTGSGLLKLYFEAGGGDPYTYLANISTFAGTIELANGGSNNNRLVLSSSNGALPSALLIDSGSQLYVQNATPSFAQGIKLSGAGSGDGFGAIRLDGTLGGNLTLQGDASIGSASGTGILSGNVTGNAATGTTQTLTVGTSGSSANVTLSGAISDSAAGGKVAVTVGVGASNTVTLSGNNSYTGTTTISSGTLQIGTGSTSGTLGTGNVIDNSKLVFKRSDSYGYAGAISGTGSVTQSGSGTLTLSGSNTYAGTTSVSAGILKIGSATALGSTAGGTSVASGAVLDLNGQAVAGAEALTISGSGSGGTGALINSSATAASWAGTVTLGAASTIGGTGNISLGGSVGGAYTLTKESASTLTLGAASNSFSALTINGGTVIASASGGGDNLGGGTVTVASGTVLQINASDQGNTVDNAFVGAGLVKLVFAPGGASGYTYMNNFSTSFTGTVELANAGPGTNSNRWVLTGFSSGGSALVNSGTQLYVQSGTSSFANGISVSGVGGSDNRGAIRLETGTLNGNITLLGNTTVGTEGGTINGAIAGTATAGNTQTLTLGTSSSTGGGLFSGAISDGAGGGKVAVAVGVGTSSTVTFSGNSSYTGTTTISGGTLLVSGSIGGSAVTVENGATLASGSTGTVGASVAVNSGGTFAPGGAGSVGTAIVTGAATLSSGSIFAWDINSGAGTYDKVTNGSLANTSGSKFNVGLVGGSSFTDAFWNTNQTWTDIFSNLGGTSLADVFSGGFGGAGVSSSGVVSGQGYFTMNASSLSWTAVPELSNLLAGGLLGAGLLRRRRGRK